MKSSDLRIHESQRYFRSLMGALDDLVGMQMICGNSYIKIIETYIILQWCRDDLNEVQDD